MFCFHELFEDIFWNSFGIIESDRFAIGGIQNWKISYRSSLLMRRSSSFKKVKLSIWLCCVLILSIS